MNDRIRVLHVDDDPQFAELTGQFLRRENEQFETVTRTLAEDALDYLAETDEEVHCVVSDYALPDLDGLQLLRAIRADHPNLPFILFTGMGSETVARDALTGGATDYLQKQGGTEQYGLLANRIQDAVQQYRTEMEREWSKQSRLKLYEISSDTELSIDEKIVRLLELGCAQMGLENGHVVRIDVSSQRHEIMYAVGSDLVRKSTVTDLEGTFCRHTLDSDGLLAVYNAVEEGYGEDPAYKQWGIGSYIGGRIEIGQNLYGTVCFVDQQPRERAFTEGERTFVDLVARWLSHMFERREYEQLLRQEKEMFRRIAESATDAILMIDTDSTITFANQSVERIFGYTAEEIEGEPLTELMPERFRDQHRAALNRYLETGEPTLDWTNVELAGLHKDGHEIDLYIAFSEVEWSDTNRFTGIVRTR